MNRKPFKIQQHCVLLVMLLTACNGIASTPVQQSETSSPAVTSTAAPPPAATATPPASSQTEETGPVTPPAGTYLNPVFDQDFPDPDVIKVENEYYAYATNSGSTNIQSAHTSDLMNWETLPDALPVLPAWAVQDFGWAWAPEVTMDASGKVYLMYFTARFAIGKGGTQCIGVATSEKPEGPFQSQAEKPFICQTGEGGSIDASSFIDEDGTRYLLWKNDGNSVGGQAWIHIQKVSADGLTLEGEAVKLIKADQRWEGVLVEGPTLWKHEGRYYLFYSANDYASPRYTTGWAVADDPLGPYQKAEQPLLKTDLKNGIVGPGGQDVVQDSQGETWILFHDWTPEGYRSLNLADLEWEDGTPIVTGLGREPQPGP